MGDTIWVDMQDRKKGEALPDNSIMLRLRDELDGLAGNLGVRKLSDFYDYSEFQAQFDEEPRGDGDLAHSTSAWFDPVPALAPVRAMLAQLRQSPESLAFSPGKGQTHWLTTLMQELKHSEDTLHQAAAKGCKFRFLIVP